MSDKILDIDKIGEKSKIELSQLKLVLKEMLKDIRAEEESTNKFKIDISTIIAVLENKNIISKDEYESLKDKIESLISDMNKVEESINSGDYSNEAKEEIIKNSSFKGFYSSYEDLITKIPNSNAKHGDYAFVKDFEGDRYDLNNITCYTFDVTYEKWMLSSDLTILRNVQIRDEEGRNGRPIDRDILIYDDYLKRWLNKTFDEADINRKSVFDNHFEDKIDFVKDDINNGTVYQKNNGRLIIDTSNIGKPNFHPMHIDRNQLNKLLKQIDEDYYKTIKIEYELDEQGVERLLISQDDNDEYGNPVQRNITNKVLRDIIDNINKRIDKTFDIKKDPNTGRILKIEHNENEKYLPRTVNTFNIDKIINAIDEDFNNSLTEEDKTVELYENALNEVLTENNDFGYTEEEIIEVKRRIIEKLGEKELFGYINHIPEHKKNKNVTPGFVNKLIEVLNYLDVSKDLIRDEFKERDLVINGNREFKKNITISNNESEFVVNSKNVLLDNTDSKIDINSKNINFSNNEAEINNNSKKVNLNNNESVVNMSSKSININNSSGVVNVNSEVIVNNDITIRGNLFISDPSNVTNVGSENTIIKDNIIILNDGEPNSEVTKGSSGILVDRGTSDNFYFGYDEIRKSLVAGYITEESKEEISKTNIIPSVYEDNIKENKPLVYNKEHHSFENVEIIDTDFYGANSFFYQDENDKFSLFDVVRYNGNELVKCDIETVGGAEAVGVVSLKEGNKVKITMSGILKNTFVPGIEIGSVLYLTKEGNLGHVDETFRIHRKIAIQTPQGLVIDIQKNSGKLGEELFDEYNYQGVLNPGEEIIDVGCVADFNKNTKVFVDGLLLYPGVHYELDIMNSLVRLYKTFDYPVEFNIITSYYLGNAYTLAMDDYEIDEIFDLPLIYPYNKRYVLATNRDIEEMFEELNEEDEFDIFENDLNSNRTAISNSEIDDNANINFKIFSDNGRLYFVSTNEIKRCTFISIDEKGEYIPLNDNSDNVIGVVQNVKRYKNGLYEHEVNTNKIIPYSEMPLVEYMNYFEIEIEIGDTVFFNNNKINKNRGFKIGQFAKTVFFLEFDKQEKIIIKQEEKKENIIRLETNKFYEVSVQSLDVCILKLFEVDTPNYCFVKLINNSEFNSKSMFATLEKDSKKLCNVYRNSDKFVIMPIRDLALKTDMFIREIEEDKNFVIIL